MKSPLIKRTFLVSGCNGQLGQFLVKYLLDNQPDIQIIGTVRHKSYDDQEYIYDRSKIITELMDLSDQSSIEYLVRRYCPTFFVNTSANAFVGESWKVPEQQFLLNTVGVLHQLKAIRDHSPFTRYINLGTSEEFACYEVSEPQNEDTKISPRSPYGCSKAAARYLVDTFRNSYNLYVLQPWAFNFESFLRGNKYVTKKITQGVARIAIAIRNKQFFESIKLGNLDSNRSWQFAGDVADALWRMLNQEEYNKNFQNKVKDWPSLISNIKPYVISASDTHTIREFVKIAFECVGIEGYWNGKGLDEKFVIVDYIFSDIGDVKSPYLVEVSPEFFRPLDVTYLHGNATRLKNDLGWNTTLSFNELVNHMVQHDLKAYESKTK